MQVDCMENDIEIIRCHLLELAFHEVRTRAHYFFAFINNAVMTSRTTGLPTAKKVDKPKASQSDDGKK